MRTVTEEKSIAKLFPELLVEWDFSKNATIISPTEVSKGSNTKVWWICPENHSYEKSIKNKNVSKGFPYCSGKKANRENCLKTLYPNIAKEWNYKKNLITPLDITPGSSKKVWWICNKGHEYECAINGRKRGNGCPYCANKKVNLENCLKSKFPNIALEWDYNKNDLTPLEVLPGSTKKVYWICSKNHSYEMPIYNRIKAKNCPICSNKIVHENYNLKVLNPNLAKEWHPIKNKGIRPEDVPPNSNQKVWWVCSNNNKHEWEAYIANRHGKNSGCPYCSNLIASEETCLATVRPDLAIDWDIVKNNGITPKEVLPYSNKSFWWTCPEGHSYKKVVADRSSNGSGCSVCFKLSGSSFPEFSLYFYLKKLIENVQHRKMISVKDTVLEADLYLPDLTTVIEYDGKKWHMGNEEADKVKNQIFNENGYKVIRIRESPLEKLNNAINYLYEPSNLHSYATMIQDILKLLNLSIDINEIYTTSDLIEIRKNFYHVKRANSIASIAPYLMDEWNNSLNIGLNPFFISYGSNIDIWWKCSKGHDYKMNAKSRMRGRNCPYCSGKCVNETNSFAAVRPELLYQWDSDNEVSPYEVTAGSKKIVKWRCPVGPDHVWKASIYSKVNDNCPYCLGRRVSVTNNLNTVLPELSREWHSTKNGELTPSDVTKGMSKIVWWQCDEGHEWQESLNQRSNKNTKCRICKKLNS